MRQGCAKMQQLLTAECCVAGSFQACATPTTHAFWRETLPWWPVQNACSCACHLLDTHNLSLNCRNALAVQRSWASLERAFLLRVQCIMSAVILHPMRHLCMSIAPPAALLMYFWVTSSALSPVRCMFMRVTQLCDHPHQLHLATSLLAHPNEASAAQHALVRSYACQ